jgi:hypothetical protein
MFDHPFGSYYHWCALLCGFSEAALEHGHYRAPATRFSAAVSLEALTSQRIALSGQWPVERRPGSEATQHEDEKP